MWNNLGIRRLALALSIIWILTFYFLTEQQQSQRLFLLLGLLPIVVGWLGLWTFKGFDKQKQDDKKSWRFRITWWK